MPGVRTSQQQGKLNSVVILVLLLFPLTLNTLNLFHVYDSCANDCPHIERCKTVAQGKLHMCMCISVCSLFCGLKSCNFTICNLLSVLSVRKPFGQSHTQLQHPPTRHRLCAFLFPLAQSATHLWHCKHLGRPLQMTVAVTGGTGFVGKQLVGRLAQG